MVQNDSFKSTTTYFIRPEHLKCSSEKVVYLFTCKTCSKQYKGKTEVNHNGEDDWEVRLTDKTDNVEELTKSFGNTFQPNGLIEREAALF